MGATYKIDKIYFNRLFKNHIPYYIGMSIVGPRGGRYLIDSYYSEIIIKNLVGVYMLPDFCDNIMRRIARELNSYTEVTIPNKSDNDMLNEINLKYIKDTNCTIVARDFKDVHSINKRNILTSIGIANKLDTNACCIINNSLG